ncbi:hypothetical protein ACIBI9_67585 [Nonomuraea sp. NPDC050451]|uniref:hypothetical protein n=1 Tax=Nonomuraea sp. NPDC050451 TaxID=3364364 RepID=UPI003794BBE8
MTTLPTLVVPVGLDALVVNPALWKRDGFRTWQHNYQALDDYKSPEPDEGDWWSGSAAPPPAAPRHG